MAAATESPGAVEKQFLTEVERFVRADERLPESAREEMVILYGHLPSRPPQLVAKVGVDLILRH